MNLFRLNRLLIAVLLSAMSVFGFAQNNAKSNRYFANTPNGVAYFDLSTQKILVSFRADVTIERQTEIFSKMKDIKPVGKDTFLPSPRVAMLELQPGLSESQVLNILSSLNEMNEVVYANPFLVYQDGTLQGLQDRFTVKLKSPSGLAKLQVLAKDNGCEIDSKYEHDPLVYFIRVNKNSTGNALEMANKFASTNQFEYAEPDFLLLLKKYNTNDPLLTYQWALNNTGSSIQYNGTPGADMRVFSAWGLSTGNAATKVAIIDEGVDLVHPDLVANMLGGYDGTLQGSGGAPQGDDAHGTACAGIVAASANNNLGVAGIAYNSKIVPVRIAYGSGSSWITSNSWIGTSIDWAWNQGDADVLSNSWGGGSSSSLINDAISRAVTQGRGGLGAVVIFAAGNDNGAVSYPGTLTNVISVAAMSMCNQRKSPTSCDSETWWGSNYGTNVDVAAPGVKIHTTDISGSAGYSSGDYAPTFNGTSSACPNTAGVMALILALNPSLTQAQARQILESTCDKVGGYTYNSSVSGQPNGTWSTDLGYGRVNAFAALQLANPVPCTEPPAVATVVATPSSFCTAPTMISLNLTGITFGTGQSYIWESSTDNTNWSIISGATEQSLNISISGATYFRCRVFCESGITSNVTYVSYTDPTITTYPHSQNFDGSSGMPCGWSIQNVNNDGNTWSNSTSSPRSAPNAMYYTYNATNAADDWFFSAPLQMQSGVSYRVNFWYRAQSASYPERMEVKWGNAPNADGMYPDAIFTNNNIANTTYAAGVTSVMSPAANGIYYVGFHINSLADMYNLMVDDIVIEIAPNCATPNVGGTASGSLTPNVGTSEAYNLTGYTGTNIQWQTAVSPAGAFADVVGQTSATGNITFSAAGEYLIRAKVSSDNCTDAYSNVLTVNVVCPSATVGTATGPATLAGGQTGAFSVDAATGNIFNWQMSIDGGTTFTDIAGTASLNASFALPTGSIQVRFMSRFGTCTPAYSNVLTVNVTSPIGNTLADPINITLPYTTTMTTAAGSGFTSTYSGPNAQASPDVFFRFTTGPCVDSLRISTCTGTTFDTYLHLLNASGTNITSLDDNGPYCTGTRASMKVAVTPNTVYYVVVEGYSTNTGTFNLEITPIDNPIFSASIDVPGGTLRCEDDPAMLIASSGTEYLWSTDETTSFIYALETGVYSVIVENENGCQALASVFIEFLPLQLWYDDLDGDGYGNDNTVIITCYGGNPGQILVGGDCNDANPNIYPGATELCNLVDDNCSFTTDEGFDVDGDGYSTCNGDCNDNNALINPGAQEICNTIDDNCNASIDEGFDADGDGYTTCNGDCDDNNANIKPGAAEVCDGVDNDCDLAADEGFDEDLDGYSICNGDCDDNNATVHPNAAEACNGVDDDCDQSIDEGFDLDGDGFTTCNGDCDDNNSNVYPGATDICANGVNEDCVGGGLGDNVTFDPFFPTEIYVACDENILNLEIPFVINGCGDEEVYVEAIAVTGGCAGRYIRNFSAYSGPLLVATTFQIVNLIDEVAPIINCPSNITATANLFSGTAPVSFAASASDNCSENVVITYSHASGSQFPVGVTTVTATATDDCGNVAVCTFDVTVNAVIPTWYYDDNDNDGYGDPNTGIFTSNPPVGYITVDGDCNDNNADVNPDAAELCNGYDDNCDTVVDEGCCFLTASASAIDAPCAGVNNGAVNTTVMNATYPVTYLWSNGATTANLSGLAAGVYSVTVIDANGCSAFANATVANLGGTAPAAPTVISGPNGVCRNTTGHVFTVTPVPGAISYQWTLPNGATGSSTTNSITLNFSSSYNTGNLCVRAVNACGMSANYCRSVLAFTSNPSLPGVISGPALNVCAGTTQTYSINPVTNATSYSWTVPSTATIESGQGTTSITVSFGAGFTSSGSIAVRSVNCFGQSSNRTMNVYAKPGIPGTIVGETFGVCGGTTQNYSVPTLAGAASYLWTVPAGAVIVSGQGTNAISVTLPSNFISGAISVAGQSACGSGSVRTKNIFSVPSISGSITGQATGVCSGNYTYSIAVQTGVTSYNWTLPTGCTMVTNNGNSVVINVPSNFVSGSICVSGTNGCGSGAAKCLTISGKPATPASITGPANTCPGQTGLVFSTAQVNNYTYTWTVPASCTITSGQGTNTVTVNWGSATGTIAVRANTPCGTSANRTRSVPVVACLMEPENDSNPFERFEATESALRIYPNPNDGHFMIESDVTGTFVVYNELGQEVKSFTLNSDNLYSQEIEGLTTGFYFIKGINDQEGLVQKIVVTNK